MREHFPVRCTLYIYGVSQRATLVVVEAVETGGCPHAAIREDISANLAACESLTARHATDFLLLESGGDNLAANFSRELADLTIYVIDVAGGVLDSAEEGLDIEGKPSALALAAAAAGADELFAHGSGSVAREPRDVVHERVTNRILGGRKAVESRAGLGQGEPSLERLEGLAQKGS